MQVDHCVVVLYQCSVARFLLHHCSCAAEWGLPCRDVGQEEESCMHLDLDACLSEVLLQLQPMTVVNTVALGKGI